TPNLEQVTCREPRVTPINSAISSRLFPRSTRFLICWILSGVNFVCLPRARTWPTSSAVISGPPVHFFLRYTLCCSPDTKVLRYQRTKIPKYCDQGTVRMVTEV